MTRTSEERKTSTRPTLENVGEFRFYRKGSPMPARAQPLDPGKLGCKWHFVRLDEVKHGHRVPLTSSSPAAPEWMLPPSSAHGIRGGRANLQVTVPRPGVTLTRLFRNPETRAAWGEALPETTQAVRQINGSASTILYVPRSTWTSRTGRSGAVGNAYDYAVGSLWAGDDLRGALVRVRLATMRRPRVGAVFWALQQMLREELDAVRQSRRGTARPNYFRGLVLLAELDAMSRGPAEPPRWISGLEPGQVTQDDLRQRLEANYPDEVAAELAELVRVTVDDLKAARPLIYNPVFGVAPGFEHIAADGDVIVGDTLFELKTSIKGYERYHLWQLLGYSTLDRLHGKSRIRRVGLFNPRRRHLWTRDLDVFVRMLGGRTFDDFVQWFRQTPEASGSR